MNRNSFLMKQNQEEFMENQEEFTEIPEEFTESQITIFKSIQKSNHHFQTDLNKTKKNSRKVKSPFSNLVDHV